MKKLLVMRGIAVMTTAVMMVIVPMASSPATTGHDLAQVKRATVQYHDLRMALADGYQAFLPCIDADDIPAGMGQHYVRFDLVDGEVNALEPEALMYEVREGSQRLVGIEYVVPQSEWSSAAPPSLFGEEFTRNDGLGIWALHAWIWRGNPTGTFEDFNPTVSLCP